MGQGETLRDGYRPLPECAGASVSPGGEAGDGHSPAGYRHAGHERTFPGPQTAGGGGGDPDYICDRTVGLCIRGIRGGSRLLPA